MASPAKLLFFVFSSVLLASCTLGPDFHAPGQSIAKQYTLPQQHANLSEDITLRKDWYKLLGSHLLNQLIDNALTNNPTLKAGLARLKAARYQLAATTGSALPDLDLVMGAKRQRANGAQIGIDNPRFNNVFNLFSPQLQLSYDFDLFGHDRRQTEAAKADYIRQTQLYRASRLALVNNLVASVIRYATLSDQIKATQAIIAAETDQVQLLHAKYKMGAINAADLLRAQAQLQQSKAKLPGMRHQQARLRTAIASLIGGDPGSFTLPPLSLSDLSLPTTLPRSLPSDIVQQRPDILAAQAQLHAATARVGVAKANRFPQFQLTASVGSMANRTGDLLTDPSKVWSLGASLFAPLFHGHTLKALSQAAKARLQAANAHYQATVLDAFHQVVDVLNAIQTDTLSVTAQQRALKAANASLELIRKQYKNGAVGYLSVLNAERIANQSQLAYLNAAGQRYLDTTSLYHVLGGGWWNDPATAADTGTQHD